QGNPATGQADPVWLRDKGPRLAITLELPPDDARQLQASGLPVPPPYQGTALVDTGADLTFIDLPLVRSLQLPLAAGATATSSHAGGPSQQSPLHWVAITFPAPLPPRPCQVVAARTLRPRADFDLLLGRDIL